MREEYHRQIKALGHKLDADAIIEKLKKEMHQALGEKRDLMDRLKEKEEERKKLEEELKWCYEKQERFLARLKIADERLEEKKS
eukprot:scaffold13052_cov142-Skeletonema_marinoi.AAC.5